MAEGHWTGTAMPSNRRYEAKQLDGLVSRSLFNFDSLALAPLWEAQSKPHPMGANPLFLLLISLYLNVALKWAYYTASANLNF